MKSSKLDRIKQRVQSNDVSTITTEFYFLAKELGCLPDLLGREYDLVYEDGKIVKVVQKPMAISSFISLMNELQKDYRNQEKMAKKGKKGRR